MGVPENPSISSYSCNQKTFACPTYMYDMSEAQTHSGEEPYE